MPLGPEFDPYAVPPSLDELAGGLPPPYLDGLSAAGVLDAPPPMFDVAQLPIPDQGFADPFAVPDPFVIPDLPPIPEIPSRLPSMTESGFALPDALTDAGGMPAVGEIDGVAYAPTRTEAQLPERHYRDTVTQYASDPFAIPDDGEQQRYFNELAARDPAKFAEIEYQRRDAQEKELAAKRQELANRDWDLQQANMRAREDGMRSARKKSEDLDAEAQRMVDEKIDPTGGLKGFEKVAAVLMGIFGGLLQGKTGSASNTGLDALNTVINRRIDAQKTNLAKRREALGMRRQALNEERGFIGEEFQQAELTRLALLKYGDQQLAFEQQKYDPRGSRAIAIAKLRVGIGAEQAKARSAFEQKNFENYLKLQEVARQQELADETIRNNRAQLGLGYARLSEDKLQRLDAAKARAAERAAEKADKEEERDRQFTVSMPRPGIAVDDKGNPVMGLDGKPVLMTQRLVNKDGKSWRLGSNEEAAAMKAKIVAASEITDMIDEVIDIRNKVGGELMPWSDAKQRLALLQERMRLVRKSGTQGMSSDKDFEALGASIGASNLNSFIDQSPGLREARERTISELNTQMRTANYDGAALTFENRYVGAKNTPEDDRRKSLIESKNVSFDKALKQNLDKVVAERGYGIDVSDPADQAIYRQTVAATRAAYTPGADQSQSEDIARLGQAAADGDAAALAVLHEVAAKAQTGRLRQLAKTQIEALTPKPTPRGPQSAPVAVPDELRLP